MSTGTKIQQSNLRKLARKMEKDPKMLIPECLGECGKCPFERTYQRLLRVQKYSGNLKALNKLSRSGKPLERAYAAMLVLAAEDTPIMFAIANLPGGDASYTIRGNSKKEVLIGIQHIDDVKLRLLAYSDIALKKGLHIYSSSKGLQCAGTTPNFPEQVISEALRSTGYSFVRTKGHHKCEHLAEKRSNKNVLTIDIESAGHRIGMCKTCSSNKQNIYTELTSRMLAKRPERDIKVILEPNMDCINGDECSLGRMQLNTEELVGEYRSGSLSDRALMERFSNVVQEALKGSGSRMLVMGDKCYEDDVKAFIDALEPSEVDRIALEFLLETGNRSVIVSNATPNAVISQFWEDSGLDILTKVTGNKELAKRMFSDSRGSDKPPSQILKEARMESRSRSVLAALPELKDLGNIGGFAHEVAKTYKALGKEDALRAMEKSGRKDTKQRSVSCGFLMALDTLKSREWQFTKEEKDFGRYLSEFCRALLDSSPEDYKDALNNLLTASGSGEIVN